MEELMSVNVIEAGQDLIKYTLDTFRIHTLMVSRFHQLVQITIHVFHADM
jgi:hypothetical protein